MLAAGRSSLLFSLLLFHNNQADDDGCRTWYGIGHSSVKELFTPGQEAAGARPSRAQVRNSSSETHLLKTVASGGAWHSQEDGEEALVTGPNFRPNRQESVLGMRSCH